MFFSFNNAKNRENINNKNISKVNWLAEVLKKNEENKKLKEEQQKLSEDNAKKEADLKEYKKKEQEALQKNQEVQKKLEEEKKAKEEATKKLQKIEQDEKKESKLLIGKCKPEEKKDKLDLSLSPMNSESTKFSQSLKSNSHDMPIISRKETLNALSTDNSFSFDLKNASSFDDKNIKQKSFLGKKSKIHFNVIKENSENNIDNPINNNLENDLNQIYYEKGTKTKPKIRFYKKNIEKLENVKIGRWTFQERIKFIKALIENGKKWKLIQKQIGTRTCTQTRSHAQKFIIKLKSIENDEFDFNKNSIKNLNDIIEEIRKKYIMKKVKVLKIISINMANSINHSLN